MTSGENLVDISELGAQTPDGSQAVLMSQHLYDDLLGFAGGDETGLRVIVPDLASAATLVSDEGDPARYEASSPRGCPPWGLQPGGSDTRLRILTWLAGKEHVRLGRRLRVKSGVWDLIPECLRSVRFSS